MTLSSNITSNRVGGGRLAGLSHFDDELADGDLAGLLCFAGELAGGDPAKFPAGNGPAGFLYSAGDLAEQLLD